MGSRNKIPGFARRLSKSEDRLLSVRRVTLDLNNPAITPRRDTRRTNRTGRRAGRRLSTRTKVLLGVGAFLLAAVLVLAIEAGVNYNKIHEGISVTGIDLGGLSEDEATAALETYVRDAQATPVTLTGDGKTWEVMPAEAGTKFDVAAAVAAAMGVTRESNVFVDLGRRWKLYFSDTDLPLQGSVDDAKLGSLISGIAEEIDLDPVDAGLAIENGDVKVVGGQRGQAVDQDALSEQLSSLFVTLHSTEVAIPLVVIEPAVRTEDNQVALDAARTIISSPITLADGDKSWTLTPADLVSYVEFKSESANGVPTLVPSLSVTLMHSFFAEIEDEVAKDPVDATFASDGYKAWVVPAQPGEKLDPDGTAAALTAAALETTGRTAEVAVMESEADFTTEEAEAWGIKDKLASYETEPYSGSSNRQVNVRITTKYAENVFLAPGEEYDFDEQIGPRTAERGYRAAPGIVGDGVLEDVLGGGICQVSTTLFNAVFEAGLEIVERHNHSLYISHYPDGRDATVAGQYKNFRFRNDTDHYVWIRGRSDGVHTRFTIYGTDDGREVKITFSGFSWGAARTTETRVNPALAPGETKEIRSGQSGRTCSVKRTVTMPDGTILFGGPEVFYSNYPMMTKLIETGPTTTTTTTHPSTTTTTDAGLPPDITAPSTEF